MKLQDIPTILYTIIFQYFRIALITQDQVVNIFETILTSVLIEFQNINIIKSESIFRTGWQCILCAAVEQTKHLLSKGKFHDPN